MNNILKQVVLGSILGTFSQLSVSDTISGAAGHAPLGVMGDHTHHKGEWMLSYRFMHMDMGGNLDGDDSISADTIATTVPNRFFGNPGQPPTLRIVPTKMTMDMHMLGVMYAPTEWLTLMAMGSYIEKEMDHITYMGGMGTNRRGTFKVKTDGIGDTTVGGLIKIYEQNEHHIHLNAAVSLPTGDNEETHQILTPMGGTPTVRVPYAMQLGSGTVDLKPGITYTGKSAQLNWGGQYMGTLRTGDDNGYSLGDEHMFSGWLAYEWQPAISTSLRLIYRTLDNIDGRDPRIAGPVQTADPDNYGGDYLDVGFGINFYAQSGALKGHRFAIEYNVPIEQDLNGPQMETDSVLTAGWQYAF